MPLPAPEAQPPSAAPAPAEPPAAQAPAEAAKEPAPARPAAPPEARRPAPRRGEGLRLPGRSVPRIDAATRFVSFNFDNADIYEVIQVISEITGLNYVVAPGVSGKVTIETAGRISVDEVFDLFHTILETNNLTAVRSGNVWKILPITQSRQTQVETEFGREPGRLRPIDKVVTRVLPLYFISASKMAELLKPFVSKNGEARAFAPRNLLVLVDLASNIQSLLDLIEMFDVDTFENISLKLLPVKHLTGTDLVKDLDKIYTMLGIDKISKGGGVEFLPIDRVKSVLILASTPALMDSVESLIEKLDIEAEAKGLQTFVYFVEHRKATELASLLTGLYGADAKRPGAPPTEGQAAAQPPRPTTPLERAARRGQEQRPAQPPAAPPPPTPAAAPGLQEGLRSATEGPVRIIADEVTNSLIVQSTPGDYQLIEATIKKLDLRPKQVLLEMLFLEVTLGDDLEYGVQALQGFAGGIFRQGEEKFVDFRGEVQTAFPGIALPPSGGLAFNFVDAPRLNLLFNALASESRVKVLSNPHLLATNNKQASINVGDEVPIVTGETTTGVAGVLAQAGAQAGQPQPVVDRNVQFRPTGVTLTFTPSINTNNLVTLDLDQEFSNARRTVTSGIDAPTIQTRKSKSTIVVQDGNTVLLAGLISENETSTDSKVPLLGSIPVLGRLFSRVTKQSQRTELLVAITPRVVKSSEEAASLTTEFQNRVLRLKEQLERAGRGGS
ncbi:MAG: type II secretion system secretin GspD [Candidatus Tectomicrobia bacterium]|nr:type II secretion system secretin GspD [Candidatus Tectomicrobia bacterium]